MNMRLSYREWAVYAELLRVTGQHEVSWGWSRARWALERMGVEFDAIEWGWPR